MPLAEGSAVPPPFSGVKRKHKRISASNFQVVGRVYRVPVVGVYDVESPDDSLVGMESFSHGIVHLLAVPEDVATTFKDASVIVDAIHLCIVALPSSDPCEDMHLVSQ